ncbi:hypothetical protein KFK09_006397 [Dendrobium nobile]|uniref:RNase H type-1 domain-containing protein n=1 Tax=Dendrobium nobile TaxID=94219 RepID=A0A8T3BPI2_DENNO|nr:hypothetical protein KFK09_006397 [Dendrobium nobile]
MLQKKGIQLPSKCFCCSNIESIDHLFVNGLIAQKVWTYFGGLANKTLNTPHNNFISILKSWVHVSKGHIFNLIPLLIVWYIWKARNDAKHNVIKMEASNIISNVRHKILQLHSYNLLYGKNFINCLELAKEFGFTVSDFTINSADKIVKWIKPKPPYVKLNSDGSVGPNGAGAGGIIRDYLGNIIVAYTAPIQWSSAISTELKPLLYGLEICIKLGINFVWIELDVMLLIQIIDNVVPGNPNNFYLIRKIKNSLSVVNYYISHIYREANVCADWLAKRGCNIHSYEELDTRRLHPLLKVNTLFSLYQTLDTISYAKLVPTSTLSVFQSNDR